MKIEEMNVEFLDQAMTELREAEEVLREYGKPSALIDIGNVYFAANVYKKAYEELKAASLQNGTNRRQNEEREV